jgi:hypothetical protein
MIIKPMAISRCPYCHAIIDEADKYCNNCGTQLLFSEDEEVEEEIPGEKIIEAEVEEKDYAVDEPESERKLRPAAAKDPDDELEEGLPEGPGRTAIEELMAGKDLDAEDEEEPSEEVVLVDETGNAEAEGKPGELEAAAPAGGDEAEPEDEEAGEEELADEIAEDLEDEAEEEPVGDSGMADRPAAVPEPPETPSGPSGEPAEPEAEYLDQSGPPDEAATAGEASLRPGTFDSQELERLGRTVELGREKIDKFIEVMAAKNAATEPPPAEPEQASAVEPEAEPEPGSELEPGPATAREAAPGPPKTPEPSTGTLPPWASTMKGAPIFLEETGPLEAPEARGGSDVPDSEEVEIFPGRRVSDSTIGLPEEVDQTPLPFAPSTAEAEDEGEEEGREETAVEEPGTGEIEEEEAPAAAPLERERVFPERGEEAPKLDRAEVLPADETAEPAPRPPWSFAVFFKSKAFDLLFVGLFWLAALWLAAGSMDVTLFDVLGAMSGSMILLYAVFVLLYFFLFKFFLGETLGDRLFRPREGD